MIERIFLDYSSRKLRQLFGQIEVCLGRLSDDEIWSRGHESDNSMGNLCLHLGGKVRQWIISGVGGAPDVRDRDAEFAAKGSVSRNEMLSGLKETVEGACVVLDSVPPQKLVESTVIQGYTVTGLEAIYQVVQHFSQHTGQIIFATKAIRGEDLGLYRDSPKPKATP